ncbi:hypothetical protein BGW39_011754 [Mortierella sp. 14UC]|nr:hypothetical protein BGW39_011754 [Mortierella sp. 14UC]
MGFWDAIGLSRDGKFTRFLEKIPIVGYGVAAVQAATGNPDHAKRALATSTNSLITAAGSVGGFIAGGPVGAVAGGALASQVGMLTEFGISKTIDDDKVKGDVGELSVKRAVLDAVIGGAAGAVGGGAGVSSAGKEAGRMAISGTAQVVKTLGYETVASTLAKTAGKEVAKGAVTSGVMSGLGQGSRNFVKTGDKDPEPKRKIRRVVTVNQQALADQVEALCRAIRQEIPLEVVINIYFNLTSYWNQFVIAGQDWETANHAVEMQFSTYESSKRGEGQPDLWTRCRNEVDEIIRRHGANEPLTANQQTVLNIYLNHPGVGPAFIIERIQDFDNQIYAKVIHLRAVMKEEKQYL